MATTKEHMIQYCKDHNFKLREEDFDGSIHQYSKYLSKTILLFIGVSDTMLNVGIIVLDTQQQVYKKDTTLPLTLIEPSYWRLHLSTMVHDVVAAVFDEMTGLGFNPKK